MVSIGRSGAGKSVFTQFWTGLKDDVVLTHQNNNNQDCTGAVCNLLYDPEVPVESFHGIVRFHSADTILKRLTSLLKRIVSIDGVDKTCGGRITFDEFTSLKQIQALITNGFYKDLEDTTVWNTSGVDVELHNGFREYFKSDHYIQELSSVGDLKKTIADRPVDSSDELKKYNWIQHPTPLYLIVKEICLYVNPGDQMEGILESFEVADTKGASANVGPDASKDILHAIDESDAAFSIHLEPTNSPDYTFYTQFLHDYLKDHPYLPQKHFVIFNRYVGLDNPSANSWLRNVRNSNTSCCIYDGCLKDENAELFSIMVICDMLGRIAKHVNTLDKQRLSECNSILADLKSQLTKYKILLNRIKLKTEPDKKEYVRKAIETLSGKIMDFATSKMNETGYNEKSQPIAQQQLIQGYLAECQKDIENVKSKKGDTAKQDYTQGKYVRYISPFEVITAKKPSKSQDMENINGAVNILLEEVKGELYDSERRDRNIGTYLNEIAYHTRERLRSRRDDASEQRFINITPEKNELFQKVWEYTYLNDQLRAEGDSYPFVKQLCDIEGKDYSETLGIIPQLFSVYDVLQGYFTNPQSRPNNNDKEDDVVKDEILKTVLVNLITRMNLRDHLAQKYVDRKEALYNMYEVVKDYFTGLKANKDCETFYLDKIELLSLHDPDYAETLRQAKIDSIIENGRKEVLRIGDQIQNLSALELPDNNTPINSDEGSR